MCTLWYCDLFGSTHPRLHWGATALTGGPLAFLRGQGIHHPQGQGGGPVSSEVRDRVQQGHVGPAYQGVAHFGVEGHAGHIHAVQRHLQAKGRRATQRDVKNASIKSFKMFQNLFKYGNLSPD